MSGNVKTGSGESMHGLDDGVGSRCRARGVMPGGLSRTFHKVVCVILSAAMIFSSVPTAAIAQSGEAAGQGEESEHPDGAAEDDALTLTKAAPEFMCLAKSPDDEAKQAEKEYDKKYKEWKRLAKTVGFAVDGLHAVNKTAGLVGDYGLAFFDMIKGCALGDFAEVFYGGVGLMQLIGAFPGEDKEDDVMDNIENIKAMTDVISKDVERIARQQDILQLQNFQTKLQELSDDTEVVETMFYDAQLLAEERGVKKPAKPVRPKPVTSLNLPAEPSKPKLPAEPTKPELPAEPQQEELAPEPVSPDDIFEGSYSDESEARWEEQLADWDVRYGLGAEPTRGSIDYQYAEGLYEFAHAAWEEETARVRAQHEQDVAGWQAECDRITAEHDKARADWQAECDRINAEHDKARADWQAECDRLYADANEKNRVFAEWNDGVANRKWGEQCTEYVCELVKIIKEQEKEGSEYFRLFDGFSGKIHQIENDFQYVADQCAQAGEWSPFSAYDDYWDRIFNWETQGYYLRKAFRVNVEFWLKRSYTLLAAYRDLDNPDALKDAFEKPTKNSESPTEEGSKVLKNPYAGYTLKLEKALSAIEDSPAGISPESIDPNGTYAVKCLANGKIATGSHVGFRCEGEAFSDNQAAQYTLRLYGDNVKTDLMTAGLYNPIVDTYGKDGDESKKPVAGIFMRGKKVDGGSLSDVRYWEATMLGWDKKQNTCETCQLWVTPNVVNVPRTEQNRNCSYLYFDWE